MSASLAALVMASAYAQSSAGPGLPGLPQQPQAVINDNIAAPQGKNIWERSNLFGDLRGLRAELAAHGIYVRLAEVEECFGGSGANFFKCMFLSAEGFCRSQAASTAAQSSGAVVALPVKGWRLNCCFLIFAASSRPRMVTAAVSNRLNPSIGRTRCFIRR